LLQRMESSLIFGSAVPLVMERLPGVPVVTIHDSLLVPAAAKEPVRECLMEAAIGQDAQRSLTAFETLRAQ
ncbi:MAG: hypothetical protein NTV46_02870, partial [Verrucomicrobia bacterium]|nr:hypothetical protein [Verrucomicrobiota bacterium]